MVIGLSFFMITKSLFVCLFQGFMKLVEIYIN